MNGSTDYNIEEMLEFIKKMSEPQRTELLRIVCSNLYREDGVLKSKITDYYKSAAKDSDKTEK